MKEKRLTLNERDAAHVYEWLRMYWRGDGQQFGGCHECARLAARLERVIGASEIRRIARVVEKYPCYPANELRQTT